MTPRTAFADSETTQPINYLDSPTLETRLPVAPPEPSPQSAGHRTPGTAQRLRKTARKAAAWLRRTPVARRWDDIWPPMLGVVLGLVIDLALVWWVWSAITG